MPHFKEKPDFSGRFPLDQTHSAAAVAAGPRLEAAFRRGDDPIAMRRLIAVARDRAFHRIRNTGVTGQQTARDGAGVLRRRLFADGAGGGRPVPEVSG